jgi:hypothetical protein
MPVPHIPVGDIRRLARGRLVGLILGRAGRMIRPRSGHGSGSGDGGAFRGDDHRHRIDHHLGARNHLDHPDGDRQYPSLRLLPAASRAPGSLSRPSIVRNRTAAENTFLRPDCSEIGFRFRSTCCEGNEVRKAYDFGASAASGGSAGSIGRGQSSAASSANLLRGKRRSPGVRTRKIGPPSFTDEGGSATPQGRPCLRRDEAAADRRVAAARGWRAASRHLRATPPARVPKGRA